MPNIEIHGYGEAMVHNKGWFAIFVSKTAFSMKEKIDEVMQEIGLGKEAITTIFPSIASTCDGEAKASPFIRISNTKPEETAKIVEALKKAHVIIDTETLTLTSFISSEEMEEETED